MGIPGNDVQLLLDRVESDFEDAAMDSRTSRLAEEVEEIFERKLGELRVDLESRLRTLEREMDSISSELEQLKERLEELQRTCEKFNSELEG